MILKQIEFMLKKYNFCYEKIEKSFIVLLDKNRKEGTFL